MKTTFAAKFGKDLRAIKDEKVLAKTKELILKCQSAQNVFELDDIKKMHGFDQFYRVRLGDYRIGLKVVDDTVVFIRFLHRKDMYRFFP